jgi:hypothetical protein
MRMKSTMPMLFRIIYKNRKNGIHIYIYIYIYTYIYIKAEQKKWHIYMPYK